MGKKTENEQYVLLPAAGLRARARGVNAEAHAFLLAAEVATGTGGVSVDGRHLPLRVLDSIGPDGAKLVELPAESRLAVRGLVPSLRLVPVRYYTPAVVAPMQVATLAARPAATAPTVTLKVLSKDNKPVAGAVVVALTDVANRVGAQAVTDSKGHAVLALGSATVTVQGLFVYPAATFWSLRKRNLTLTNATVVSLLPLDLAVPDALRYFYGEAADSAGQGVTVGVVDTGIATHPDLVVSGGANTVTGEDPKDFGDNGKGHGTHVAGIVAGRGHAPSGVRGVAPGVKLRSYRVFAKNNGSASSFAIAKAIDQAVADKCDLLNMSLGGGPSDPVVTAAVDDARAAGSLCIIAAGNDRRQPVSFPANLGSAVAVSAMGRKGTLPPSAAEAGDVASPYGTDKKNFVASFSNVGPEVDLTGPGVGIISTWPTGYAEISGTSMACPAVTGAAARAVATPGILKNKRDANRSDAMLKAVLASAGPLGFGPPFEGHGLPVPT